MKFVIPQNYKFKAKLFGMIEYQTVIIIAIWGALIFLLINFLFKNLNLKIMLQDSIPVAFCFLRLRVYYYSML